MGLLLALSLIPAAVAEDNSAVILMYHRFGEDRYPSTSIRLAQFEAHLDYLAGAGHQVWALPRLMEHLRQGKPIPPRTVAITIDDAYLSVYQQAFPRLKERGWPFTVFVATDPVDEGHGGYMTWDQLREMARHGASFGNHSRSHGHLIQRREGESESQWRRRVKDDLQHARRRLAAELGPVTSLLAYPYGEYDTDLAGMVRELGYVALGQQSGAVAAHSDLRNLPRFPMAEAFAAMDGFKVKVNALAMPVARVAPWDPVVSPMGRPRLELTVDPSLRLDQLRCYASGQGEAAVQWLDKAAGRLAVRARQPLQGRRARYNCTAPAGSGHFYWFSHLWIDPQRPEE